ncbi:PAS domain-containing hybrid sensor histidine kinase/response regulator [Sphingomonas xinjiangensis]|uniref:histidine kinase n=1 Tax=Sphingomonas xinjiangensis TaxID=643568 RepID=A0A840YJG4_9SPHN|nr:ATP-binding protein [Sphingomonas xinjiangensis]MBB5712309.1 PAS domain S-box-containing protein [Sphingomonas xinjiangensis]
MTSYKRNLRIGAGLLGTAIAAGATWRGRIYAQARAEIRAAERQAHASQARFRSLMEATAAIVWWTDPEGEFIENQPSWEIFTGQPLQVMSGRGWLQMIHPEDREGTAAAWTAARATLQPYEVEHRVLRHDGVYVDMLARAVPVRDDQGDVVEWVGVHTDISARKSGERALIAAKEEAEQATLAKSQFIANMSHELRTPLSAVIGYAEMLQDESKEMDPAEVQQDLKKITTNARHLLDLINAVLDLSKLEAGRDELYIERVDVDALVQTVADTAAALVNRNGNRLVIDVAQPLGEIGSDLVKLRQCLFNLVSNAAKFTENGVITVGANRTAESIVFTVADTGIGMTEEQRGKLFERFVQADNSVTRRYGGSGLGLALTRAFADLLGGSVAVESEAGEGSTFTLEVPLESHPPVEWSSPGSASSGQITILVIDDEAPMRELLGRFLRREGFHVVTAADGAQGLAAARSQRPAAIILDVLMPQVDGWSVLGALKADAALADIPVVMVTSSREKRLSLSLGAMDHLPKPVDWTRLKSILAKVRSSGHHRAVLASGDEALATMLMETFKKEGWALEVLPSEALSSLTDRPEPELVLIENGRGIDIASTLPRVRRQLGSDVPIVVLADDLEPEARAAVDAADAELMVAADVEALVDELKEMLAALPLAPEGDNDGPVVAG